MGTGRSFHVLQGGKVFQDVKWQGVAAKAVAIQTGLQEFMRGHTRLRQALMGAD